MAAQRLLLSVVLTLLHLSSRVSPLHGEHEAFSQVTVKLPPCVESRALNVSVHNSLLLTVPPDLSHCNDTQETDEVVGFRISTRILDAHAGSTSSSATAASSNRPVIFTARQSASDGFVSWNAPLSESSHVYPNVSHTMCPVSNFTSQTGEGTLPLLYIDSFTSEPDNVFFTIEVKPVVNFVLHINQTYTVKVGPATPQVYYFKIPSDVHLVTVEVASKPHNGCTIVSIQNHTCPVNDLVKNVKSKGIYQTMANSSFITIDPESSNFTDRAFLLVLVATDFSDCYSGSDAESVGQRETVVNITISGMPLTMEYVGAMMLPIGFCAAIYCLSILVCCFYAPRFEPGCIPIQFTFANRDNPGEDRTCCCSSMPKLRGCKPEAIGTCSCVCWQGSGGEEEESCRGTFHMCGKVKEDVELCVGEPGEERRQQHLGEETAAPGEKTPLTPRTDNCLEDKGGRDAASGTVYGATGAINSAARDTADADVPNRDGEVSSPSQKAYHVYSWNTVTVGIFYALPAIQLVFSEQKILDQSGDQDSCYYNFKCAHPVWFFSAFNNMWSNLGYILLGVLFLLIVFFRHWQYIVRQSKYDNYMKTHGVPQFFGVYYAMGFALIIEGFMSSFYHICPSDANFQFDTAFMFITGGIILVKVYQNRHPKVQANAFIAFFTFAIIIFFTLVGIYNDGKHPFSVKIIFLFFALVIISLFLAHFYKWKFELDDPTKRSIFDGCTCSFEPFRCVSGCCRGSYLLVKAVLGWLVLPGRWKEFWKVEKYRIGKHLFIFCCNLILGIVICIKYKDIGIATGVLTFFVANIILYLAMYCVIKICYGEPWTWLALVLPVFIALSWGVAFHFYGTVTEWKDTPAVSRGMNDHCIVLGFYDSHDVWHFFSACGMFTAFLFVLVIDDGVVDINQKILLQRAV